METKNYTTTVIKADEGKYLTQADPDINASDRIFVTEVNIGEGGSVDDWLEISSEEAAGISGISSAGEPDAGEQDTGNTPEPDIDGETVKASTSVIATELIAVDPGVPEP